LIILKIAKQTNFDKLYHNEVFVLTKTKVALAIYLKIHDFKTVLQIVHFGKKHRGITFV